MGLFIAFEGIEGCGKTTQIELLKDFLYQRGVDFMLTREPGGTALGEQIRAIFLHSRSEDLLPLTELLLITASRVQHIHQVIQPALDQGRAVICDRYIAATLVYQGCAGGVSEDLIRQCHERFCSGLMPDLTIVLDCPVEVGLSRSRSRNHAGGVQETEGRFEGKHDRFHQKVRDGYLALAAKSPGSYHVIDSRQPIDAVHTQICARIGAQLEEGRHALL